MIGILCSGCIDLYYCHFVLRLHGPIQLPFCAQVAWTYTIAILCSGSMDLYDWHLCSGCMDLFCMCELTAQRLNMKSRSEGIWYQQKILETLK